MGASVISIEQANPELWLPSGKPIVILLRHFSGSFQGFFGPCALKVNTVLVAKLFLLCTVARGTHAPGARFSTRLRL